MMTPSPAQRIITPLSEKPLPSPPIAQDVKDSPLREARSLIDASEKPLRRSPPGMPHKQEDWPVLMPKKSSNSMIHRDFSGSPAGTSTKFNENTRFGALSHPTLEPERHPITGDSLPPKVRRKEVSITPRGYTDLGSSTDGFKREAGQQTMATGSIGVGKKTVWPDLSAGAVAIEKSIYEGGSQGKPSQSRTFPLRARLCSGKLIV